MSRGPAVAVLALLAAGAAAAPEPGPLASRDVSAARQVIGAPAGKPLRGEVLEAETRRVGALLRCPVCQGLSVADSPATMAVNMRHEVRALLEEGYGEEQILGYFERSYGEFVRLEPPLRGVNWTLWLAPLLGLLARGALVAWMMSGGPKPVSPPAGGVSPGAAGVAVAPAAGRAAGVPGDLPEDPELARAVLRVREMAHGWPGGVRPERAGR